MPAIDTKAAASLMKALQFLKMAGTYFEDVTRSVSASDYRRFRMDQHRKRIKDSFNEIFAGLDEAQAAALQNDLNDSVTLDSIFTNATLLTIQGRERLEKFTLDLLAEETGKLVDNGL